MEQPQEAKAFFEGHGVLYPTYHFMGQYLRKARESDITRADFTPAARCMSFRENVRLWGQLHESGVKLSPWSLFRLYPRLAALAW